MTKSRGILGPRKKWTDEERKMIAYLYPFTLAETLAKLFDCKLPQVYSVANASKIKKSAWFKASSLSGTTLGNPNIGANGRFLKGHDTWNKGIKGLNYEGSQATQFKPGQKPKNHKPIGSKRIDTKNGYVYIKMAEGMFQYQLMHRMVWQRLNGPIPHGYLVSFIDGNKLNWEITNLSLITKKQNAIRNSMNRYGPEIAQIYQLKGAITRQINKRERANHE